MYLMRDGSLQLLGSLFGGRFGWKSLPSPCVK